MPLIWREWKAGGPFSWAERGGEGGEGARGVRYLLAHSLPEFRFGLWLPLSGRVPGLVLADPVGGRKTPGRLPEPP